MTPSDPWLEKRRRHLARRRRHYAANQLERLNAERRRLGKQPYASIAEIGADLIRTAAKRARDERGRFL